MFVMKALCLAGESMGTKSAKGDSPGDLQLACGSCAYTAYCS